MSRKIVNAPIPTAKSEKLTQTPRARKPASSSRTVGDYRGHLRHLFTPAAQIGISQDCQACEAREELEEEHPDAKQDE